jgi:hypothetical protein
MKEEIRLFLLILSVLYTLHFVVAFVIRLTQEEPEPMTITKLEQMSYLVSLSYIITYFLI